VLLLHVLVTLSAIVGIRVNDLQVCVMAGRKRSYLLIVVGFFCSLEKIILY